MSEAGRSVDPLELLRCLLEVATARVGHGRLAERENTLADTSAAALDEQEVVLDQTVAHKGTERVDVLLRNVVVGGPVGLVVTLANAVDLLVGLGTVVVTVLTSTGDTVHDLRRVPCSNAGDLSETLVRLSGKLLGAPSGKRSTQGRVSKETSGGL